MSLISHFRKSEGGNVAVLFGLAVMPAVMAMGLAVDYSRVSKARTEMQAAVDAAAIAAARRAPQLSDKELTTYAKQFFHGNLTQPSFDLASVSARREGKAVIVESNGTLQTSLMAIVPGMDTLDVQASARVRYEDSKVEVALVLDNTGSMGEQGRLGELKKAATNFVNILESSSYSKDAVKISVVPFSARVKLNPSQYRNASWLRFEGIDRASWAGCIDERNQPFNTNLSAPNVSRADTLYVGTHCKDSSNYEKIATVTRLTQNFGGIRKTIDDMVPVGFTNITLGAHWGAMTLSDKGIFADGAPASNSSVQKYMIVLTDGDNTKSRHSSTVAGMNSDTLAACSSAKAEGIKVYTILLVEGNENMLRDCASSNATFTRVSNVAQLDSVFSGIAHEISNIRLTN